MSVFNLSSRHKSDNFVALLFLIFPIALVSIKIIGNLILLILSLIGLKRILKEKINPFVDERLRIFTFISLGYFLIMLFSIILSAGLGQEILHIARKLHFLFAPLIAVAFLEKEIPLRKSLFFLKFFIPILAIAMLIQGFILGDTRPSGMLNTNIFSDIVVILTFISISNIFREEKLDYFLSLLSAGSGLFIILLNYSRGSWIVFFALFLLLFFLSYKDIRKLQIKKKLLYLIGVLISIILLNTNSISTIISQTVLNLNHSESKISSSGIRLEMWKSSKEAIPEMPWHGYGYRLANKEVAKFSENYKRSIEKATHLHNEYITHLMSAGAFGLTSLFAILFLPAYLFFKHINYPRSTLTSQIGLIICVGYSFIGTTHLAFGEEHVNALYVFYLAFLIPKIKSEV